MKPDLAEDLGSDMEPHLLDDWDAAGVAEEGKAGAQMLGRLMVAIAFVALVAGWAVLG